MKAEIKDIQEGKSVQPEVDIQFVKEYFERVRNDDRDAYLKLLTTVLK